ncbi:MAG: glycoside hydrolase family 88 protein [Caldilineaceae bacterium]|nr:glycoside hydrolase family 88 protein [Caldilineaceae bacterium]
MTTQLEEALSYSLQIIQQNIKTLPYFPERYENGAWVTAEEKRIPSHWVDGFWTGLLWLAAVHTKDPELETAARAWTQKLAWLKETTDTHDLGFIFYLSNVLGYRITGDESFLPDALTAAATFTRRYNPRGEYMQAWGHIDGPSHERGRINVDLMMNMPFFLWASANSGNLQYGRIAVRHARTSRHVLMRPDGSISQVADFNPETGVFLRQETHQGLSHDTCWSRGLGWALYGFAEIYRWTGDEVFLYTARQVADYAIANAPEDKVPFWDYNSLDIPNTYRDSSAASVIAAGLLELAAGETDAMLAARWRAEAEAVTLSLWQNYSTRDTTIPAILVEAARSVPHHWMEHSLIYGDYYFVETLVRLLRPDLESTLFSRQILQVG